MDLNIEVKNCKSGKEYFPSNFVGGGCCGQRGLPNAL